MKKELYIKLNTLSQREKSFFYKRLMSVLNDRYSCFAYGGMTDEEYSNLPLGKLEKIEEKVYEEMFNHLMPKKVCSLNFHYFSN